MARRLPTVFALLVGLGAAAGCLLTSDFDGVAGVRPVEAGVPTETGGEGGEGGDGGAPEVPTSPCSSGTHAVCTDFDHPGGGFPVPGWNNAAADGGILTLDNTTAVTSPLALRARVEGEGAPVAYLYRQVFLSNLKALTVSVDMRIVACPAQGKSITVIYVEPSTKVSFGFVFLSSGVQAVGAGVNGAFTFFQLEQQIPDQTWSHVVYRILLKDASTAHLTLTVDGKSAVDTDAPGGVAQATTLLNIGLLGSSVPKGCEVQFDNYVLDQE